MKRAALISFAIAALFAWSTGLVMAATANVGQHIHVEIANLPTDGHPIPKTPYTFHVTIRLHNQTGKLSYLRVDDYSTTRFQKPIALGPCADCSVSLPITIDFSGWSTGRHELRWHADVPRNSEGNRQFTTSRAQVCLASCSPNVSGRATPFDGGGSWYLDDYATIYDRSPDSAHRPGGSIVIQAAQDARRACAFLNPDFHHGSSGTILGCWSDTSKHTVAIPASAHVGDKLVLLATQANGNGGVLQLALGDGSDRATRFYGVQSWWASGPVVLP